MIQARLFCAAQGRCCSMLLFHVIDQADLVRTLGPQASYHSPGADSDGCGMIALQIANRCSVTFIKSCFQLA